MPKNIFIGGTGRSGTTVLAKTLGTVPEIYTFPRELRFHVDPGGLSNLLRSGTLSYNPPVSGAALKSFVQLMTDYLTNPGRQPYRGFDFPDFFGKELYWSELEELLMRVCLDKYPGFQLYADPWRQIPNSPRFVRGIVIRIIAAYGRMFDFSIHHSMKQHGYEYTSDIYEMRYFKDPEVLSKILGKFFEALAIPKINQNNSKIFCEHTPGNGCEGPFIAKAFPNSCLILISRNPVDVALSYKAQAWAPKNLEAICEMLKAQYSVWERDKKELDRLDYAYMEIKIEDLTRAPTNIFKRIFELADIEANIPDVSHLLASRHSGNRSITAEETKVILQYFPEAI